MKILLSTLLFSLSILATACNAEVSGLSETATDNSDSNNVVNCFDKDKLKMLTRLKSGFYIVDNPYYDVFEQAVLSNENEFLPIDIIKRTELMYYINDVEYPLTIDIKSEASVKLQAMTENNVGQYMAMIVDDEVLNTASILAPLSDSFMITGFDNRGEAKLIRSKIECAMRYSH